ncbi:hypothetical protein [uncultured Maricaulis sp.]|uniref:hypothetical protein n=1 Tax=uncultured Maricaulis sp. TaxID=174710 RepID=UPI0030D8EC53|tara:strand:- start:102182 stop:102775 length:594 start_codon:yes stop_codon:yes gene_type:complete
MTPNRPGPSRLRTIALSLATAALGATALSAAAQAQDEYIWVRQSTAPADAVTPQGRTDRALCRATDNQVNSGSRGSYFLGWFDGTNCLSESSGNVESFPAASTRIEFLVPTPGHSTHWVEMGGRARPDWHTDALSGGYSEYGHRELHICSVGGGTGSMRWGMGGGAGYSYCAAVAPEHPGGNPPIYKLVGTIVSIYD